MQNQQPKFTLELEGADVDIVMNALAELPAKTSRATMNKLEQQLMQQVQQAQQQAQQQAMQQAMQQAQAPAPDEARAVPA